MRGPQRRDPGVEDVAEDTGEQRLLIGEVQVDSAFGDSGAGGDVADAGAAVAPFEEQFECGPGHGLTRLGGLLRAGPPTAPTVGNHHGAPPHDKSDL